VRKPQWIGLSVLAVAAVAAGILAISQSKSSASPIAPAHRLPPSAIQRDRDLIATALKENPGRERAWLDSSIRTRLNDRTFLLAALPYDSISPEILDGLANSPDPRIALEVVRNPNTHSGTLERIYRSQSYPEYFSQALAAHRHTPPEILRDLYKQPHASTGDIWFAANPATPREILAEIARSAYDTHVIGALLENPSLDCWLQGQLARNLMKRQNRDADNPNVQRLAELVPTCTPGTAL
jgi:hypothetical protein